MTNDTLSSTPSTKGFLSALPWGVSIALSWTWGLGLFFSVQIALHFGPGGLFAFAIPNAIGLMLFGVLTQRIAQRQGTARDFERHFFATSNSMRWVILAYQLVAITLTFFAVFRYLFMPLGVSLPIVVLIVLGAALLLGEQFNITRIKWSHLAMFVVILIGCAGIAITFGRFLQRENLSLVLATPEEPFLSWNMLGFAIPMLCGLLVGPWLDVQQWQRAIQIHRERTSIRTSYFVGGSLFFCILIFHGMFALFAMGAAAQMAGPDLITPSADGLYHAKDAIVRLLVSAEYPTGIMLTVFYSAFIFLCILSTLDSGYVALSWYLKELTRKSEHIIMTLLPPGVLASPVVPFLIAVAVGVAGVPLHFELEYFMSFYASFAVGYALVFLFRATYRPEFTNFTQTTLFSVAAVGLGVFGMGYFEKLWFLMAAGALIPVVHGLVVISSRVVVDDLQKALPRPDSTDIVPLPSVSGKAAEKAITALENAVSRLDPKTGEKFKNVIHKIEPQAAHALAMVLESINPQNVSLSPAQPIDADAALEHAKGHFEGKWFHHSFLTTYNDTNSVGNIYFANYIVWVGKVREMFFSAVMPNFDLKKTDYYILTRQIEHKFNLEAKEFELVTVKIRIESFNRKFVTLEHHIMNQAAQILGKGKQILMFVNSRDYNLVDLPNEARTAFLPYC